MVKVTVLLKQNEISEKGEMPLYLRIIKNRKAKFISLGLNINPYLWDSVNRRAKKKFPNAGKVNALIAKRLSEAESTAVDMETDKKFVSSKKIKDALKGKGPISFLNFSAMWESDLLSKGKIGTYKKVKTILQKLKTYLGDKETFAYF